MGKLVVFLSLMIGLSALFYFAGIMENNSTSLLLDMALNPEKVPQLKLSSLAILAIEGIAAVSITLIGIYTGNLELALMAPVAVFVFDLSFGFVDVFNKLKEINYYIAILVFAPVFVLLLISVLDWWRGRD